MGSSAYVNPPLATPSSPGAVPSWPPVVEASLSAKGLTFDMASVDEASQNFEVAFQQSYFNHNPRPDLGMSFGYNTAGAGGEPGLYLEWENYYDTGDGIFMEWYLQALSPGATQAYRPIDVMVKRDLSLIVLSHYCDSVLFYARTAGPTDSPILSVATGLVNFGSIHTSVVPDGTPVYFGGNGDGTNPVVRFRTGSIDDNPQYGFFLSTHYASSHSVAILGTRDGVAGGDITAIKLSNAVVTMPRLAGTGTRNVVVDANGVLSAP